MEFMVDTERCIGQLSMGTPCCGTWGTKHLQSTLDFITCYLLRKLWIKQLRFNRLVWTGYVLSIFSLLFHLVYVCTTRRVISMASFSCSCSHRKMRLKCWLPFLSSLRSQSGDSYAEILEISRERSQSRDSRVVALSICILGIYYIWKWWLFVS